MATNKKNRKAFSASPKRAVIYARVSSNPQEEEGTSLDSQEEACRSYALANGITVVDAIRETHTGFQYRERTKLGRIREMAQDGEFDILLIYAYDRLARNYTHLIFLMQEFENAGVTIVSIKEPFDSSSQGRFMRSVMGYIGEVEREKIIDRTSTGRRNRVLRNNKILPGSKPPYGYKWDDQQEKNTYVIDEQTAEIVREVFDMYANRGFSLRKIAAYLLEKGVPTPTGRGMWGEKTIRSWFLSKVYIGKASSLKWDINRDANGVSHLRLRPEEEWVFFDVPRLVSDELFYKAQERLAINKVESRRNNHLYEQSLLRAGVIRCGYCKSNMAVTQNQGEKMMYRCPKHQRVGNRCVGTSIRVRIIDEIVWKYVGEIIEDFSIVEEAVNIVKNQKNPFALDASSIERSITLTIAQIKQTVEDLDKVDPDGTHKIKGLSREYTLEKLAEKEKYLSSLYTEKAKVEVGNANWKQMQEDVDRFIEWCLTARDTYDTADYEEKRRAFRSLGLVVYIYQDGDPDHKRHDIQLKIPHIVFPTT